MFAANVDGTAPFQPSTSGSAAAAGSSPSSSSGYGTVTNSAIPGFDSYATASLTAKTAYQKALAQINGQRQTALQQYGYRGTIDPTSGTLTNMSVDPNNPYGMFQEMLGSHADQIQQAKASAAARGLGHGGLAAQGITADQRSFGADSARLGQSLMSSLEGLQGQQNDAQTNMNDSLYKAELDAARQAIAAGAFTPTDISGVNVPPYDAGADTPPTTVVNNNGPNGGSGGGGVSRNVNNESSTAFHNAIKAGKSPAEAALAARSAGLNAAHGLGKPILPTPTKKSAGNAYITNKNKRG